MERRAFLSVFFSSFAVACLYGQTTQGLISGRALDSRSGRPLDGATVSCSNRANNSVSATRADAGGFFVLPLLSPGVYRVRISAENYQPQELHELELPVAGRIDISFRVRPLNDVWEAGQYRSMFLPGTKTIVTFYGPDVDSSRSASFDGVRPNRGILESSVSQVVSPVEIQQLPLAGRDVYTMLVTQAGVTAITTTARSLGLSSNGQRPSASNFLLDGLENNNYLVTGPLTSIAPEDHPGVPRLHQQFLSRVRPHHRLPEQCHHSRRDQQLARYRLLQSQKRGAQCQRLPVQPGRPAAYAIEGDSDRPMGGWTNPAGNRCSCPAHTTIFGAAGVPHH